MTITREQIIAWARLCDLGRVCGPLDTLLDHEWEDLHRFAALIEQAVLADENEQCARVCDRMEAEYPEENIDYAFCLAAQQLAAAIRARRNQANNEKSKVWEIWEEGYRVNGGSGTAVFRGRVEAPTFREACEKFYKGDKLFDPERLTLWGCRIFDNEADARRSFG